eukprot:gene8561-10530_t
MKLLIFLILTLLFISPFVVQSHSDSDNSDDEINEFAHSQYGQIPKRLTYDYVVLGAGAAGSIVASKLSDNSRHSVLLVEAGGWALNPAIHNAANWSYWNTPDADRTVQRMFYTTPQTYMNNRILDDSRAYGTGGCSLHNAMNLVTASKYNFDKFAELVGSNEWNFENMKSSYQDFKNHFNLIHEESGLGLHPQLQNALHQNGYSYNPNPFDTGAVAKKYGTYVLMMTNNNSTTGPAKLRQTPYTQYVEKFLNSKPNLDVIVHEKALKLDYGRKGSKLYVKGVLVENVGTKRLTYIKARKEIIISMGAYETPKFLQLNGIGDRNHLQSLGINTVVHSPGVGQNLRNHLFYYYVGKAIEAPYNTVPIPQVNPIGGGYIFYPDFNGNNIPENKLTCDFQFGRFRCFVENGNVKSHGYVKIISKDHNVNPLINENELMDQFDRDIYVNGMREMFKIQDTLVGMGVLKNESFPLGSHSSYNELLEAVKNSATNNHHPCCSVRMGPANDEMSPLTWDLRLKGFTNVRVVDASNAPENMIGNINAPVSIMAIKASQIIINTSN